MVIAACGVLLQPETWLASLAVGACCALHLLFMPMKRLLMQATIWDSAVVIVCALFTIIPHLR